MNRYVLCYVHQCFSSENNTSNKINKNCNCLKQMYFYSDIGITYDLRLLSFMSLYGCKTSILNRVVGRGQNKLILTHTNDWKWVHVNGSQCVLCNNDDCQSKMLEWKYTIQYYFNQKIHNQLNKNWRYQG